MNQYIQAVRDLDIRRVEHLLYDPKWRNWSKPDGKNALHYLCELNVSNDVVRVTAGLQMLELLLNEGMDINSVHLIDDKNCYFPATPLWYAYARGRNETLYTRLLEKGANPDNCMWAIAWNDDVKSAKLFIAYGAKIDNNPNLDELFLGAFQWKRYVFAKWLVTDMGANINCADKDGNTALLLAVKRKDAEIVKLLLEFGADYNKANKHGISPRKLAESKGPRKILNLFAI